MVEAANTVEVEATAVVVAAAVVAMTSSSRAAAVEAAGRAPYTSPRPALCAKLIFRSGAKTRAADAERDTMFLEQL